MLLSCNKRGGIPVHAVLKGPYTHNRIFARGLALPQAPPHVVGDTQVARARRSAPREDGGNDAHIHAVQQHLPGSVKVRMGRVA